MLFHILSVSVRQKLIAMGKIEILGNWLENEHTTEISGPNFDELARIWEIFFMCRTFCPYLKILTIFHEFQIIVEQSIFIVEKTFTIWKIIYF